MRWVHHQLESLLACSWFFRQSATVWVVLGWVRNIVFYSNRTHLSRVAYMFTIILTAHDIRRVVSCGLGDCARRVAGRDFPVGQHDCKELECLRSNLRKISTRCAVKFAFVKRTQKRCVSLQPLYVQIVIVGLVHNQWEQRTYMVFLFWSHLTRDMLNVVHRLSWVPKPTEKKHVRLLYIQSSTRVPAFVRIF